MDPNLIASVNQLIDKQDTTIAMLQAVVRAIYDNAGISGQGTITGSGNINTTTTNVSIPIPLPVILSGGTFDVNVNNQPLAVNASQSGTWNVGITGQPIAVTFNQPITVNASQSGTWNVGIIGQPIEVTFNQPTYKYAIINANTLGDTTIVSAISNKKIRVVAFALVASGTVDVKFRRGTTDITGTMRLVEAGGIAHAFQGGLFETGINQALVINLSSSSLVQVGGYVVYQEV